MVQTNVFTARFLQSLYQPGITYSDKGKCGGAYKNGGEEAEDEKAREELDAKTDEIDHPRPVETDHLCPVEIDHPRPVEIDHLI
jgi:hypothetical protein